MGFESYMFQVKMLNEKNMDFIINEFLKLDYLINNEKNNDVFLEKSYECGFIEININLCFKYFMIRIAKPNHEEIFDKLIIDMIKFNEAINISVYDLQLKKHIDLLNYDEFKKNFIEKNREFKKFFPDLNYPIRCEEVFGET